MNTWILILAFVVCIVSDVQAAGVPSPSTVPGWQKVLDTPVDLTNTTTNDHEVYSLREHRGLLYIGYYTAGLSNSRRAARLYTWDGTTQSLKYTFGTGLSFASVQALGEYKGDLYAGMSGLYNTDGDIYVSKDGGTTWAKSYNTGQDHFCSTLVAFKDKLYGGMGYAASRIVSFDGTTWKVAYPGKTSSILVEWMYVYKGKLYAALGGAQAGRAAMVATSDGVNWTVDNNFAAVTANYIETASLVEFKGRLYAGMLKGGTNGGDLLVLDDATGQWSIAWSNPDGNRLHTLEVYNGRLYVGNANKAGAGDVYVTSDGVTFTKDLDTDTREVFRLYQYNGSLYMGSGFLNSQAQIWRKNDGLALRAALKKLTEEESIYARNYLIGKLAGQSILADEDRWLKVQDDMAQAIGNIFTWEAGQALTVLFREHVTMTKQVIQAAQVDLNSADLALAQLRSRENVDAIATYLSGLNEHWSQEEIKDLLYKHGQYVFDQIASRIKANWSSDLQSYDLDRFYMLKLADSLMDGIINRSPGNF